MRSGCSNARTRLIGSAARPTCWPGSSPSIELTDTRNGYSERPGSAFFRDGFALESYDRRHDPLYDRFCVALDPDVPPVGFLNTSSSTKRSGIRLARSSSQAAPTRMRIPAVQTANCSQMPSRYWVSIQCAEKDRRTL